MGEKEVGEVKGKDVRDYVRDPFPLFFFLPFFCVGLLAESPLRA